MKAIIPVSLLLSFMAVEAWASLVVPAAPPPADYRLTAAEADVIVAEIFGAIIKDSVETPQGFSFTTSGLIAGRSCPLDGVAAVRCGAFRFAPSKINVIGKARVGGLSGHLARNKIVAVDMESDTNALSSGTLHGVLVFRTDRISKKDKPAFAWYVSRQGEGVSMELLDVDRDGVLDLVYTYRQWLPGGYMVVSRDVWTFVDMEASKLLSSGEKLTGVFTSVFDGVPLHKDDFFGISRGTWRVLPLGQGVPPAIVLEQAHLGPVTGWELHVLANLGAGWSEFLVGSSFSGELEGVFEDYAGDESNCVPIDTYNELGIESRRRLLDVEYACTTAGFVKGVSIANLWNALRAATGGMHMIATSLAESVSRDLAIGWPKTWPLSVILSLYGVLATNNAMQATLKSGWLDKEMYVIPVEQAFPALVPVAAVIDWIFKGFDTMRQCLGALRPSP